MPELPEVQSTVDYLAPRLIGRCISGCSILWARSIATHPPATFKKLLQGRRIHRVSRRGKYIVVSLDGKSKAVQALLIHLRMSGSLEVFSNRISRDPYDRVVIELDNSKELRFNDVRKFGKIYFAKNADSILGKLGVEPLSNSFSSDSLSEILLKRKGHIKPVLLNQSLIAGIGNIYADESLWQAGIHPLRAANSLNSKETARLHTAIREILQEAINLKGTDNGDEVVEGGMYQPKVYGRENEACYRCKTKISRIVVGQRGTHFCGRCQRCRK